MKARHAGAGKYADGHGLWLVKRDRAAGKWVLRLSLTGKRREMGLGPWPDVSIKEARERAAEARKAVRDGIDPIEERAKATRRMSRLTVKQAVEGCFEARKAQLKGDGDAGRWMSPLSVHVIPKLGKRAVEDIDQHALVECLGPLWHEKPEAARKAMNRVGIVLTHAAALGLTVDLQATMKAKALLGKQRHEAEHIPSMPYGECPAFYASLQQDKTVAARALRFLMLTIARTSEVRLATFAEFKDGVWVLPADRTKSGREHRVPLTKEARAVVEACRGDAATEHLFAALKHKPISDAAMSAYMKRKGLSARPHGFRASFRTWCEEQTDAPYEVKEACLGHAVDRGVVGAYQRSDRFELRRKLLRQWETYLVS